MKNKKLRKRLLILFRMVKWGDHDALMEAIELLLDTYQSRPFDNGYQSCLSDMSVRSQRLAEYVVKQAEKTGKLGKDSNNEPMAYFNDADDLAKVIEDYFNKHLKDK